MRFLRDFHTSFILYPRFKLQIIQFLPPLKLELELELGFCDWTFMHLQLMDSASLSWKLIADKSEIYSFDLLRNIDQCADFRLRYEAYKGLSHIIQSRDKDGEKERSKKPKWSRQ
ncbi:hypothetical protein LguiA_007490 [Lonicera macranthoides]